MLVSISRVSLLVLPLNDLETNYKSIPSEIHLKRNAPVAQLYEDAIKYEGAVLSSSGALINYSGKKTGRSPKDKRIVYEETSKDDIWVGTITH